MFYNSKPLVPKDLNGIARVISLGRLSKAKPTDDQTRETMDSSLAVAKAHLKAIYDGRLDLIQLAEQESGQIFKRKTMRKAEELIATGTIDLVIAEDLSRIYRRARFQYEFVEDCLDAGVRVICVADRLDTANEDWEREMGFAALAHSLPIFDGRRRQGRKNTFAFHNGGNVQKIKYGYRKLTREQAASGRFGRVGLRIAKRPKATRIIKTMRELLMTKVNGQYSYVPVVNWLVEDKIPTGKYVKSNKWSQRVVKSLLTDPILIGVRRFRTMLFTRVLSTGKFRRDPNPDGPEMEHYPELAHLTDDEFVTMQQVIEEIAEQHRHRAGAEHPLYRRPRKDAIFPRQHATCSACNGLMHAYDSDQIKCENAHERGEDQCWNHVQVDLAKMREKFIPWLIDQTDCVPGVRDCIVDVATQDLAEICENLRQGTSGCRSTIAQLEREAENVAKAIRAGGHLEAFLKEAKDIDEQIKKQRELERQSATGEDALPDCCTREEVEGQLEDVLQYLAKTSCGFANLMREVTPQFEIVPVQAIDSGQVRPRARITLSLEQLRKDSDDGPPVPDVQVELDLFDPPKRFRHIDECLEIKRVNPKLGYIKIAETINERIAQRGGDESDKISNMTVKRCFNISRRMEAEGLTEPYRILTDKPARASRWKRRRESKGDAA